MKIQVDKKLNHTCSHLLGAAVELLYPQVKLGFGPATQEGFYYDFEFAEGISDSEIAKIERLMKKLASRNLITVQISEDEYDFTDKPYKKELYDELKERGETITFYALQDPFNKEIVFKDLCAGGHVESTKKLKILNCYH